MQLKNLGKARAAGLALTLAVAFGAALTASAGALPFAEFGGGDSGVQRAVVTQSQPQTTSSTQAGVTVSVTGFASDDTRTVVGLSLAGRPELGEGAMPLGGAQLVDEFGHVYFEEAGTSDQTNPRLVTRYYPPLDPAARSLVLEINGLEFVNRGHAGGTAVAAQWRLQIQLAGPPAVSASVPVDAGPRSFGKGAITIDKVQSGATGVVVTARLSGFSMDEIPELGFSASLVTPAGDRMSFIGLEAGLGPERQGIVVRFPKTNGEVTLQLGGNVSDPHPANPAAAAQLAATFAAPAEWLLTLPLE